MIRLMAEQKRLEQDFVPEGIRRLRRAEAAIKRKDGVKVESWHGRFGQCFSLLESAVFQQSERELRARKPARFAVAMLSLSAEKIAFIGLHAICDTFRSGLTTESHWPTARRIAIDIGLACRRERDLDLRLGRAVDLASRLVSRNQRRSNAASRTRAMIESLDEAVHGGDAWFHLGAKVIELAITHCLLDESPILERRLVAEGRGDSRRSHIALALTDEGAGWLESVQKRISALATPAFLPMLVPPVPWVTIDIGGYLNGFGLQLVKFKRSESAKAALADASIETVLNSINALQDTAWRINRRVYLVMRECWNRTIRGEADFPDISLEELRNVPVPPLEGSGLDEEACRDARSKAYRHNLRAVGLRAKMRTVLSVAHRIKRRERFFFPYQLDRRGRAYPVPQGVNPQADDAGRALLEFCDGVPLNDEGRYWLRIHLANQFGYGRLPFHLREAWVQEQAEKILSVASDPIAHMSFWAQADKPWGFLAACLEFADMVASGLEAQSRLPVSIDGTCNGLQHLSALARDKPGGEATNVTDAEIPQDIYQRVADVALLEIHTQAARDSEFAQVWKTIDRSHAKHATMATPYGVTLNGVRKNILKKLRDREPPFDVFKMPESDRHWQWQCADYLARTLKAAVEQVVERYRDIEGRLHKLASASADKKIALSWSLPSGFVVVHEYMAAKEARVQTALGTFVDERPAPEQGIDRRKQRAAIVANFIHSLDAGHLMMTLDALRREGVDAFLVVHDSYGVHASNIPILNRVLRDEFVRLYSSDFFNQFVAEQCERLGLTFGKDVQPLPLGQLDIGSVRNSRYFFS